MPSPICDWSQSTMDILEKKKKVNWLKIKGQTLIKKYIICSKGSRKGLKY